MDVASHGAPEAASRGAPKAASIGAVRSPAGGNDYIPRRLTFVIRAEIDRSRRPTPFAHALPLTTLMPQYKVVRMSMAAPERYGPYPSDDFDAEVTRLLNEGWELHGPLNISYDDRMNSILAQALLKR